MLDMKGDRLMNNSIIFLDTPFETKEADWLFENTGRISVALDTHKNGIVKIIAYSDNVSDKKELFALAKKNTVISLEIFLKGVLTILMRTLFEAIENKKSNNYEMVLKINEQTINLKFDNGAAYTVISASVLDENFCDERAEYFEKILLEKAQQYEQDNELKAPFEKTFVSASGNQIKGYLVDSPNVTIGNYKIEHFYYYFIPQNKRPIALLGCLLYTSPSPRD